MQKSETINKLASALIVFQMKVGKISKDSINPHFKSRFASLANILEGIQVPLEEAGLAICQMPDTDDTLTTILMHAESGEYITASYSIRPAKTDPQGIGSAITYARRYALGAALGLIIDDDDDGNAATHGAPAKLAKAPAVDNGEGNAEVFLAAAISRLLRTTTLDEAKQCAANEPEWVRGSKASRVKGHARYVAAMEGHFANLTPAS